MKVNIVVGGTFHSLMWEKYISEIGIDVKLYTSTPKFKLKGRIPLEKVTFVPKLSQIFRKVTKLDTPMYFRYLDEIIFDFIVSIVMRKCDVLHGWASECLISAKKAKKNGAIFVLERACPHCIFQNNLLAKEAGRLNIKFGISQQIEKRSLLEYVEADYIIVPSTYTENSFVNRNILLDKIVKIPLQGKVDVPSIKKFQKSRSSDKFIVGVVGGNLLRKGFIYLLRAWDKMNIDNSYLYIKAEKNQLEKSNEIKEIIGRNDNIKFVGYVENINDFYQKCDIFCLPSIDEGYGMVVPEAMANSLPVITTTNVGASDLINDSVNGFIVKPFNSEILEEKIMFFYNNRHEIEKMGVNSYFKYADYLNSNDNCKNSIQKFYNSLNKLRPSQNKVAI